MKPIKTPMNYKVTVTRTQPQRTTFTVLATSPEEARQKALEECGNHVFASGGCACDEEVTSCQKN